VCETAGVTAPTLYHHFGDKDGLLRIDFAIQRPRLFRLMLGYEISFGSPVQRVTGVRPLDVRGSRARATISVGSKQLRF
jgi:AcrR family transcriptional regulator